MFMIVGSTIKESKCKAAEALLTLVAENVQDTANQAQYVVNCLYVVHHSLLCCVCADATD